MSQTGKAVQTLIKQGFRRKNSRDNGVHSMRPGFHPVTSKTIPCTFCGEQTPMLGTKLCDNCWEIKGRVDYLAKRNMKALKDILKPFGFKLERKK